MNEPQDTRSDIWLPTQRQPFTLPSVESIVDCECDGDNEGETTKLTKDEVQVAKVRLAGPPALSPEEAAWVRNGQEMMERASTGVGLLFCFAILNFKTPQQRILSCAGTFSVVEPSPGEYLGLTAGRIMMQQGPAANYSDWTVVLVETEYNIQGLLRGLIEQANSAYEIGSKLTRKALLKACRAYIKFCKARCYVTVFANADRPTPADNSEPTPPPQSLEVAFFKLPRRLLRRIEQTQVRALPVGRCLPLQSELCVLIGYQDDLCNAPAGTETVAKQVQESHKPIASRLRLPTGSLTEYMQGGKTCQVVAVEDVQDGIIYNGTTCEGTSGAPIINACGEVVGVHMGSWYGYAPPEEGKRLEESSKDSEDQAEDEYSIQHFNKAASVREFLQTYRHILRSTKRANPERRMFDT